MPRRTIVETDAGADVTAQAGTLYLRGAWTTQHLGGLIDKIGALIANDPRNGDPLHVEAGGLTALDTAGAWILCGLLRGLEARGSEARIDGLEDGHRALLDLVRDRAPEPDPPSPSNPGALGRLGRMTMAHLDEAHAMTAFIGEVAIALFEHVKHPARLRTRALLGTLERAGVGAIPIVALLSFLLGIVIAYQGGLQLQNYGANIFIAELVSLTMLREFGPMMTAIIVAGRTGSAYTAEIGTMKVTEEIDALTSIGIPPLDLLVLPKLFGLVIVLPLLTLVADAAGVLGGMVMAAAMLDVGFQDFADRLPQPLVYRSFVIGIAKAPVFAMIVAVVGCFQGFRVSGSADSVGRKTTISVVQSIFLVIIADAAFSILFSFIGI
ncbi:MAG: MlaE family lipid ABC transporter permease subunit [Pseudomonadota bacterium]|nr:MlaE family lipid ABC transporter permease subunit [Pseudomonadota bacterium]